MEKGARNTRDLFCTRSPVYTVFGSTLAPRYLRPLSVLLLHGVDTMLMDSFTWFVFIPMTIDFGLSVGKTCTCLGRTYGFSFKSFRLRRVLRGIADFLDRTLSFYIG